MKTLRLLLITFLIFGFNQALLPATFFQNPTQPKTVVIKDLAAANPENYFSSATQYQFYIFKAGGGLSNILAAISKNPSVLNCTQGPTTGDYVLVTLHLKSKQNKTWFMTAFKNAGLIFLKINNGPIEPLP